MKAGRRGCERQGEAGGVRFAGRLIDDGHSDLQSSLGFNITPTLHIQSSS